MVLFLQAYKEHQLSESDFLCAFSWAIHNYLSDKQLAQRTDAILRGRLESTTYEATTNVKNHELSQSRSLLKECLAGKHPEFTRELENYLDKSVQIMKILTFKYIKNQS